VRTAKRKLDVKLKSEKMGEAVKLLLDRFAKL
jgi:hypothetical protein